VTLSRQRPCLLFARTFVIHVVSGRVLGFLVLSRTYTFTAEFSLLW